MMKIALLLALTLLTPVPAAAQTGPVGIGFAQAEEGTWWCRDATPGKALACAKAQCAQEAGGQECHATRWCLPAGWSGMMIAWLPEFHSTIVLCGTSGEAAVIAALKTLCDESPFVTRCVPFAIVDPDGNERPIDGLDWPGPAIRDSSATDAGNDPGVDEAPR
jgi:hypothetical protein